MKEINFERLAEALYNNLQGAYEDNNVIHSDKKLCAEYDEFYNKVIEPIMKESYQEGNTISDMFASVVFGYCRQGFKVGFQAAVTLILANKDMGAVKL